MAGGKGSLMDHKIPKTHKNSFSNEVLKDSSEDFSTPKSDITPKFSLRGVLGLGQSVELMKNANQLQKKSDTLFSSINHLEQEQKLLFDNRQKELEKKIEELRDEIQQLIKATDNLEKQVENVAINPIVEPSEYQISFFSRIKNFIANFRKNITEAGLWIEAFAAKKKKRNYFWNTAHDKKRGGSQFMFSDEHGVARSVG